MCRTSSLCQRAVNIDLLRCTYTHHPAWHTTTYKHKCVDDATSYGDDRQGILIAPIMTTGYRYRWLTVVDNQRTWSDISWSVYCVSTVCPSIPAGRQVMRGSVVALGFDCMYWYPRPLNIITRRLHSFFIIAGCRTVAKCVAFFNQNYTTHVTQIWQKCILIWPPPHKICNE